ncbi:MAG: SpoIIE family protein phosphatase, partial [Candidatus Eisenbacteria bacterium]|nr:SpoIIE family protein phosphatase [Candidatus Eisenbacteria bacterium]
SGDYYDVLRPNENQKLIVAIADVSGKGLPAALLMSNLQAALHCHVLLGDLDLRRTVRNLNLLVHENTDASDFTTLFLAELDLASRTLHYVCAGHDPPIVVSRGGAAEHLTGGGLLLGVDPRTRYEQRERTLDRGDLLCLYTDGVTEARNPHDEEFTPARLEALLREQRQLGTAEIGARILSAVASFSEREDPADDLTLLLLKLEESA